MPGLGSVGIVVLAGYLLLMAWHAIAGHRATRSVTDYHVAGRALGGLVMGLSFFASFTSTNSFIGLAGRSWSWGLGAWLVGLFFVVFAWISWGLIGAPLRRETGRLGSLSLPEFLGASHSSPLYRKVAAAVIVGASVPFLQAVFKGCGLVMQQLTGLGEGPALLLAWAVVVAYTVSGGFHAVARTDAVQGAIMLVAAVSLPVAMVLRGGGVGPTLEVAAAHAGVDGVGGAFGMGALGTLLGVGFAGGFKMLSEPRQVSRYFAVDSKETGKARKVSVVTLAATYLLLLPVGLMARPVLGTLPDGDTDLVVPELLARGDVVPPLVGAVFLAAFLSAAMSSIDSVLLVVSAAIQRDLLGWVGERSPLPELAMTRGWIVLYSVVPASFVLAYPGGIIELTTLSGGIYGAAFIPPLLWALHAKGRTSVAGAFLCLLLGGATVLLWKGLAHAHWPATKAVHEVVAGAVVSLAAYAAASVRVRRMAP